MTGHPRFERARQLATGGRPVASAEDLVCLARALVLLALGEGPRGFPELPRAWPVTRSLLRSAVRDLLREGLVDGTDLSALGRLELSPRGRNHLRLATGAARRTA